MIECRPHQWQIPRLGDPAIVCVACGRRLDRGDITDNICSSVLQGLEKRLGPDHADLDPFRAWFMFRPGLEGWNKFVAMVQQAGCDYCSNEAKDAIEPVPAVAVSAVYFHTPSVVIGCRWLWLCRFHRESLVLSLVRYADCSCSYPGDGSG